MCLLAFDCVFIAASCVLLVGGCFSWWFGLMLIWLWCLRFASLVNASWLLLLLFCGFDVFGGLLGCLWWFVV